MCDDGRRKTSRNSVGSHERFSQHLFSLFSSMHYALWIPTVWFLFSAFHTKRKCVEKSAKKRFSIFSFTSSSLKFNLCVNFALSNVASAAMCDRASECAMYTDSGREQFGNYPHVARSGHIYRSKSREREGGERRRERAIQLAMAMAVVRPIVISFDVASCSDNLRVDFIQQKNGFFVSSTPEKTMLSKERQLIWSTVITFSLLDKHYSVVRCWC